MQPCNPNWSMQRANTRAKLYWEMHVSCLIPNWETHFLPPSQTGKHVSCPYPKLGNAFPAPIPIPNWDTRFLPHPNSKLGNTSPAPISDWETRFLPPIPNWETCLLPHPKLGNLFPAPIPNRETFFLPPSQTERQLPIPTKNWDAFLSNLELEDSLLPHPELGDTFLRPTSYPIHPGKTIPVPSKPGRHVSFPSQSRRLTFHYHFKMGNVFLCV